MTKFWTFAVYSTGKMLTRNWPGSAVAAEHYAQGLANGRGEAIEFIDAEKLVGWTGAHHQDVPRGTVVDPDDEFSEATL